MKSKEKQQFAKNGSGKKPGEEPRAHHYTPEKVHNDNRVEFEMPFFYSYTDNAKKQPKMYFNTLWKEFIAGSEKFISLKDSLSNSILYLSENLGDFNLAAGLANKRNNLLNKISHSQLESADRKQLLADLNNEYNSIRKSKDLKTEPELLFIIQNAIKSLTKSGSNDADIIKVAKNSYSEICDFFTPLTLIELADKIAASEAEYKILVNIMSSVYNEKAAQFGTENDVVSEMKLYSKQLRKTFNPNRTILQLTVAPFKGNGSADDGIDHNYETVAANNTADREILVNLIKRDYKLFCKLFGIVNGKDMTNRIVDNSANEEQKLLLIKTLTAEFDAFRLESESRFDAMKLR